MKNGICDYSFHPETTKRILFFSVFCSLCFTVWLFCGLNRALAEESTQSQARFNANKSNVLILNAFESNVSALQKTKHGFPATVSYGRIGIRNRFYEHLDMSGLRACSLPFNREFSARRYEQHAWGVPAFILIQTLLILWLLTPKLRQESVEAALKRQLKFEKLLSEVSTGFINLPADRIDDIILETQRRVCEELGFDFSALWQLSLEDPRFLFLTHIHRPTGGPPFPEKTEAQANWPWALKQLMSGHIVAISTKDAPEEAARDQEMWRHYGVKSSLSFPLSAGGDNRLIGALSLGTMGQERIWPEPLIKQLELLAQVYANAIHRKRTDYALKESERRLKLATTAAGAGLWIMNPETKVVWVSDKTRELFYFAPEEQVTYDRFFTVIHPDDHEAVHEAVGKALQSGEELSTEYRIFLPDGSVRWIGVRGRQYGTDEAVRLMGASVDITERKKMQERVRKTAEEWQATFDSSPDVILILDENLKIRRHNTAAAHFFGRSSKEILDRYCHDLMHDREEPSFDCPVRRSFEYGKHQEEERYDKKRDAWYQISSDPIHNEKGKVTRIVHRIKNITEHMRAEVEARKQWEHLAYVTRRGIMGELTASLAHEIKQPLTAIQSNAEAAKRFIAAAEPDLNEVLQILEDIIRDDERAGSIISRVRALLKKEPIAFKVLDLNELIEDVLSLIKADVLLPNLMIIREFCPKLPLILGDRIQLQQVIINLILNSVTAMRRVPTARRRLVIKTEIQEASAVEVSVTDFGIGIDENKPEILFEPFYTTKSGGMGMGLAISQTIIQEHGGKIEVANHPSGGAVFAFSIPVHRGVVA